MKSFTSFVEARDPQISFMKEFLKDLEKKAVIVTGKSPIGLDRYHRVRHFRISVGDDPIAFFKDQGIKIKDADISLSGSYETFQIQLDYDGKKKWFYLVNRVGKTKSSGTKVFTDKDLTPDDMNIVGSYKTKELKNASIAWILNSRYDKVVKNDLIRITEAAADSSDSEVDVDKCMLNKADLKIVSKNYGEILAGFWLMNSKGFKEVEFPEGSNYPLVDLFAKGRSEVIQVSVKSGGGSSTSMTNIVKGLEGLNKDFLSKKELRLIKFLELIVNNSVKEGTLEAGKFLDTRSYKLVQKATGIRDIDFKKLMNVIKDQSIEELKENFKDLYDISIPDEKSFKKLVNAKPDVKVGLIIGPYTLVLLRDMNTKKNLELLDKIIRLYQIHQVNVDVRQGSDNTATISYKRVEFKNSTFKFSWGGGATTYNRVRFGFKMT